MKPYVQTILHDPANGKIGNCFATCIRSLLALDDPGSVPNFVEEEDWLKGLQDWLAPLGLAYLEINMPQDNYQWEHMGFHVISGASPRGLNHSVVGYRGKVTWDPHPNGGGLIGKSSEWSMGFLVVKGK